MSFLGGNWHNVRYPTRMEEHKNEDGDRCLPPLGIMADLDEDTRTALCKVGQFGTLQPGEYLAIQGQHHRKLSFILSGELSVNSHAHGDTIHLADLKAGDTVGEMSAIDPRVASASVEVSKPTEYWWVSMEDFNNFVATDWQRGYSILKILAKELCYRIRMGTESMLKTKEDLRSHFIDMDY